MATAHTRAPKAVVVVAALAAVLLAAPARWAMATPPAHVGEPLPVTLLAANDEEAPKDPDLRPRLDEPTGRANVPGATAEPESRPFWKSWIFWTIAGAIVVGGVALAAYSLSGSSSNVEPCPSDIAVSLGCFGAGRRQ